MARYGQAFKDRAVARLRAWLEAVISCAALFETDKSAWCREHGLHPGELNQWRASCTNALAEPEEARASLKLFHKRYPNYVVPADLAPLLRE